MTQPVPRDLPEFLRALEAAGELRRVGAPVQSELEITEIATRVVRGGGPALLFEKVQGSPYPLAINIFASPRRIEIALGRPPAAFAEEVELFLERINPPSLRGILRSRSTLFRVSRMGSRRIRRPPCQEVVEKPDLGTLPALKCWPEDGGRFLTYPLVITTDSAGRRNLGLYRMQIHSGNSTGMHWQIQKGGGFHHARAEAEGRALPVAVAIGADPVLLLAAMFPLPEGMDEVAFSGFLRGRRTPMARARTVPLDVPARAEFILEGTVPPGERRSEGPFGDHYGHYSAAAPFPVFHVNSVTRKRNPIYHAAVVGKPPMEDFYLGDAVQEMFLPLVRAAHPEVRELWAYGEGGFHNLLVVSMESRYPREGIKTALGLLGEGQLSLSKMVLVVGPGIPAGDLPSVLKALRANFDPSRDFLLLPGTSMDTLDFTGPRMNLGSKMILDLTGDLGPAPGAPGAPPESLDPRSLEGMAELGIERCRILEGALLLARMGEDRNGEGRRAVEELVRRPELGALKMVVSVSADVDLEDPMSFLWGFLTRFEPARDIAFREARLEGIRPVYRGPLGIDATHKKGYPAPLEMDSAIVDRVDRRWDELFPGGVGAV